MPAIVNATGNAQRMLYGWGRTVRSRASVVVPTSGAEVAGVLDVAPPRGVIARGLGRSYGDVAQNAGGIVVDMTAMRRMGELDTVQRTVVVEAGCSLADLLRAVGPRGFFLPVTPGTRYVTVGGALACDVHGKNHHVDGSFGRHVRGLTLLTPEGERRHVARGTPEFQATAGGLGLTGVILDCTLELLPIESASMTVDVERTQDIEETLAVLAATDHRYRYSVAWVDVRATGKRFGRSVLMRGDHGGVDRTESAFRLTEPRLAVPERLSLAPLLVSPLGKLFNELYYRRGIPARGVRQSLDAFFYPLDALADWNRVYGRRGFLQYQFVVPFGAESALVGILERLREVRPTLVVLKRFGAEAGPLSFPCPGWTVAIDLVAGAEHARLLDRCDEYVAAVGGRVYLAKDARLRAEFLPTMYPRLDEWRAVQRGLDPEGRMRSDLARRLGLLA